MTELTSELVTIALPKGRLQDEQQFRASLRTSESRRKLRIRQNASNIAAVGHGVATAADYELDDAHDPLGATDFNPFIPQVMASGCDGPVSSTICAQAAPPSRWTESVSARRCGMLASSSVESSLFVVFVLLAGFCMSGAQTGMNAFAPSCYPTAVRATGVSWMLGIGRFGSISGSFLGGMLLTMGWGFSSVISILAIPATIAAIAIIAATLGTKRQAIA